MPDEPRSVATSTATSDGEPAGSPLRSLFAVISGWIVLWITGGLFSAVLFRLAPEQFPAGEQPSDVGLALLLVGLLPNGILGGLVTARIAGFAPIAHAAVLGGIIGFFGLMSSDAALGMPWWFAVGRAVVPGLCIVLGGAIARATGGRARGRSDSAASA